MELVLLISLFLLTANTFGDGTGSDVTRLIVKEDDDAILMCSFPESIIDKLFEWKKKETNHKVFFYNKGDHYNNDRSGQDEQFKGRVFHFEDQLVSGNASIVITKTQPGDSGNYTCDFPLDSPSRRAHIELIIRASPKPSVTNMNQNNDWALLECEVEGASPEPVVEWRDGAGNILPAEEPKVTKNKEKENSFNVILQIYVTKSDRYTCVSTQKKIYHQISKKIYVQLHHSSTGWIDAFAVVSIILVAVVVAFLLLLQKGFIKLKCNQGSPSAPSDSLSSSQLPDDELKQTLNA
ncbi:V-set domain-containing T-cell activation inhibitor 1-like [Embiotoca jacksoni]|uniref:V-set domain-containing T-cell activation inhibitor 1-like n=1 Tax=Embiotoca jacksoni TaxID=100190 RepID=UPI0037049425